MKGAQDDDGGFAGGAGHSSPRKRFLSSFAGFLVLWLGMILAALAFFVLLLRLLT